MYWSGVSLGEGGREGRREEKREGGREENREGCGKRKEKGQDGGHDGRMRRGERIELNRKHVSTQVMECFSAILQPMTI